MDALTPVSHAPHAVSECDSWDARLPPSLERELLKGGPPANSSARRSLCGPQNLKSTILHSAAFSDAHSSASCSSAFGTAIRPTRAASSRASGKALGWYEACRWCAHGEGDVSKCVCGRRVCSICGQIPTICAKSCKY